MDLNDPTFQAIAKRYRQIAVEMMRSARPEQVQNGVPVGPYAMEIYNAIIMQFHQDFTKAVLVRLAAGGTVRDAVRNAQKDMEIKLDDRSEGVIIDLLEKQFADEKRKKDEKIEVVVDDSFFRGK